MQHTWSRPRGGPYQVRGCWPQFTLRSLFELMTLCCLLAALGPLLGIACAASLMLLALSLHLRVGGFGLLAIMAAFLMSSLPTDTSPEIVLSRQLAASMAAAGICGWYWVRRAGNRSPAAASSNRSTCVEHPFGSPPNHSWSRANLRPAGPAGHT